MNGSLAKLIRRIHETALDQSGHDAVMLEVADRTNSRLMIVAPVVRGGDRAVAPRYHGRLDGRMLDGIAEWEAGLCPPDPIFGFMAANPGALVFATDRHLARDEHERGAYLAWNRNFVGSSHWSARLRWYDEICFGASLHPRDPHDPHDPIDGARFELLFDHMASAWATANRPPNLSSARDACLVVDLAGRVTAMSPAAEAMAALRDGFSVRSRRIAACDPSAARRLAALIAAALDPIGRGGAGGALALPRPSGKRPIAALVDPLVAGGGFGVMGPSALIRLVDPEAQVRPFADMLIPLWGLTRAEARLAETLLETGCDLRESAARLGITYATVRTQLGRIFMKSETRSQPELMRLLARLSG